MWRRIKAVYARIKAIGRRVQHRAVRVGLVMIYVVGFGATRLYASVFHRALLHPPRGESAWRPAEQYNFDPEEAQRQS